MIKKQSGHRDISVCVCLCVCGYFAVCVMSLKHAVRLWKKRLKLCVHRWWLYGQNVLCISLAIRESRFQSLSAYTIVFLYYIIYSPQTLKNAIWGTPGTSRCDGTEVLHKRQYMTLGNEIVLWRHMPWSINWSLASQVGDFKILSLYGNSQSFTFPEELLSLYMSLLINN